MDALTLGLLVAFCLLLSAFFSGSETALLRLPRHQVESEESPSLSGLAARELLRNTSRMLVTILLGTNLVNILAASAAGALAAQWLGTERGLLVSTLSLTLVMLIFCELLPKSVAARHPRRIVLAISLPVYLLHWCLRPLHLLFDRIVDPVVRRFGPEPGEGREQATVSEALRVVRASQGQAGNGKPEATPQAIIGAAARAADMTVGEIMVPRTEIFAFPMDTPPDELLKEMLRERYTRVPLCDGSVDEPLDAVRGLCHLKDLIQLTRGETEYDSIEFILKPVLQVPERKPILELLTDMQSKFIHMAIVKDGLGATMGLCTQEDILEEIVGEIRDEFDLEEQQTIRQLGGDSYEVHGYLKVLDFNRASGWEIPAERGESIGGLVFNTLGHAPQQGERADLPGFQITVTGVSGTRITRLRITRTQPPPTEEPPAESTDSA